MIEIIKKRQSKDRDYIYKKKCPDCRTVFIFDSDEIDSEFVNNHYSGYKFRQFYIKCPRCPKKMNIDLDLLFLYRYKKKKKKCLVCGNLINDKEEICRKWDCQEDYKKMCTKENENDNNT